MDDCQACGKAIVGDARWDAQHRDCKRALRYAETIVATDDARDLCEYQGGNLNHLEKMLVAAYLAGSGDAPT